MDETRLFIYNQALEHIVIQPIPIDKDDKDDFLIGLIYDDNIPESLLDFVKKYYNNTDCNQIIFLQDLERIQLEYRIRIGLWDYTYESYEIYVGKDKIIKFLMELKSEKFYIFDFNEKQINYVANVRQNKLLN